MNDDHFLLVEFHDFYILIEKTLNDTYKKKRVTHKNDIDKKKQGVCVWRGGGG